MGIHFSAVKGSLNSPPPSECDGEPIRKSVSAEDTVVQDIDEFDVATAELKPLTEGLRHLRGAEISGKTVTVKIKYSDFSARHAVEQARVAFANMTDIFDAASRPLTTSSIRSSDPCVCWLQPPK
ncbi:hypothetical protein QA644_22940 (plasmid) [Rhizobium sp. CC1099]|uniref:DinB/UmuC family translesion DNA polymerase n=1 Tax=Rhizobium sp. CC1099 TaxID=3039160 RepID=UPI0024B1891F|nr:hypothetical protein [Rhizobium sp. CC1099]WFU91086.1 hypothetical protein QA644_22940 [Rhizobium sp. CC1099]